jgi:hypothetical protein
MSENTTKRTGRPGARAKSFSIRLTEEEKCHLAGLAGRQPLATYLRDLVLSKPAQAGRVRRLGRVENEQALSRVLAALGQAGVAQTTARLANAAKIDVLEATPETEREIIDACRAVRAMRRDLMLALGSEDGSGDA